MIELEHQIWMQYSQDRKGILVLDCVKYSTYLQWLLKHLNRIGY